MKRLGTRVLLAGLAMMAPAVLLEKLPAQRGAALASITVDYPEEASIFPPEITPPTFQWRDPAKAATAWEITVVFADGSQMHARSAGEHLRLGETDPRCFSSTNAPPALTPQQAAAHTWKPDPETWEAIRKRTVEHPARILIAGLAPGNPNPVSQGRVSIEVSKDAVGAPIFYRDVPLMPSETERGVIKPLDPSLVPLIAWRLRNISEPASHVLLTDMPTCANCHSFSTDGKTFGMDLDGPQNDKALYAIVPIKPTTTIRKEDVISWAAFGKDFNAAMRVGFMSKVSPDGRYVMTTVRPPGSKESQFFYVANFKDYRFLQVFYPTRGILAWYDRISRQVHSLPGADDPRYVQASAVWSPDGKYLVFSRAAAKDPYPPGGKMAAYANDPGEVQIQYDLYRVPFNDGKGGEATPVLGASHNGMSNSFPKVSPDGRWIVFVEARNGQLMRPDSKLYIVPASGGQARLMRCNTSLMNSWHSFSPNGRWLVFSSKSRSPFTQMFLTHLDEQGRDSPPILIENSTASNRAVNIPEFVNVPPDGFQKLDVPAADYYRLFDSVVKLGEKGQWDAAIAGWRKVLEIEPEDSKGHNNLGAALIRQGALDEAVVHFRKSVEINPSYDRAQFNLAVGLYLKSDLDGAIEHWRQSVALNPDFTESYTLMGVALAQRKKLDEAEASFRRAMSINSNAFFGLLSHLQVGMRQNKPADGQPPFSTAAALYRSGDLDQAVAQWRQAVEQDPKNIDALGMMGIALAQQRKLDEAVACFRRAIETDRNGFFDFLGQLDITVR